jgi:hypothetical protein
MKIEKLWKNSASGEQLGVSVMNMQYIKVTSVVQKVKLLFSLWGVGGESE